MIASVSISFAQSDNGAAQELRKRHTAKQMMKVRPVTMQIKNNSESNQVRVKSRKEEKSSLVSGVIRLENGTPFVDVENGRAHRKLVPANFTKKMVMDLEGKEIQFRYTVLNESVPGNGKFSMVVNLHDVAILKKR